MEVQFIPYSQINLFKNNDFFLRYINKEINDLYNIDYSLESISSINHQKQVSNDLCDELFQYNSNYLKDDSTDKAIEKLKIKGCGAIITGQQPNLYAGPMYTIYKILTAIKISQEVEKKTGRPCVAIFWNGSDDHDLDEVNKCFFPSLEHGLVDLKLLLTHQALPIYSYNTHKEYIELNDSVFSKINNTDFTPFVKDLFSHNTESISSQVTYVIKKLFFNRGLIVLEPKILRNYCGDIYKDIILKDRKINSLINEAGAKNTGFIVKDSSSNLFYDNKVREKVLIENEQYILMGRKYSIKDFADYVNENKEYFSPGVAVRPIVQDYLFPTLSYIGGPGECSYFSQLKNVYNELNVFMPAITPRVSVTLITPREKRIIDKYSFNILDVLNKSMDIPENEIIKKHQAVVEDSSINMLKLMDDFSDYAKTIGNEVFESLNGPYRKIEFELKRIENKFIKDCEKVQGIYRGQIERLKDSIIPKNSLQERITSPLYYLNLYGIELIDKLYFSFDVSKFEHHVIFI